MAAADFFLVERAAQIQRLRQTKSEHPIRVPGRMSRIGYSPQALEFFRALDEIAKIPLEDKKKKKWLERLRERGAHLFGLGSAEPAKDGEQPLLNSEARSALETFEKHVVPILLDDDETAHPVAVALVEAILVDSQNYYGLKPLQFHTEEFAYEFLFPSWLNLYTALSLPCPSTGKPRFSHEQIKTIFGRFRELEEQGTPPDLEWVAALTFLANRLPALEAQGCIQRLFDLQPLTSKGATATVGERLAILHTRIDAAPPLLALLKSLILLECVVFRDQLVATLRLGPRLPTPKPIRPFIAPRVQALANQPEQFAVWAELVGQVARLIESGKGLDREFAEILEAEAANLNDWLGLIMPAGEARVLSPSTQRLLARLIGRTQSNGKPNLSKVREFARQLAPRLDYLGDATLALFEKQFVEQDANREVILACACEPERRRTISQKLLAGAGKTSDRARLFGQLALAAVLDPDFDPASMAALGRTLHVLATLQEQGFITTSQLDQLAGQLRERLPEAAAILAEPMLGVAGGGPTAKLFLALSEVCMKYEMTGNVDNFGLTKGAYGNLRRAGE